MFSIHRFYSANNKNFIVSQKASLTTVTIHKYPALKKNKKKKKKKKKNKQTKKKKKKKKRTTRKMTETKTKHKKCKKKNIPTKNVCNRSRIVQSKFFRLIRVVFFSFLFNFIRQNKKIIYLSIFIIIETTFVFNKICDVFWLWLNVNFFFQNVSTILCSYYGFEKKINIKSE